MSENTSTTFPAIRERIAQLMLGPQTWFNKRLWQVLAFALREFERLQIEGPADAEYFERLAVMGAEARLLVFRHVSRTKQRPANLQTTRLLMAALETLDRGYDVLVERFGVPGLLDATDKLALTNAIQFHLDGVTMDEADADAEEMWKMYAQAQAEETK